MKPCPGEGCHARISDSLDKCAACKAGEMHPLPFRLDLFIADGIAAFERLLERHAQFDLWLYQHHR